MESCWAADPAQRPLLGVVEPTLQSIRERFDRIQKLSQDYSLSDHSSDDALVLCEEVTTDFADASPYLNIEYPGVK
jgi:hypothetical protein